MQVISSCYIVIIECKILKIDDNNALYWRKYADINLKLNFFEEALKGLESCLNLKDESIDIYIALADVMILLGDYNDALTTLVEAQKLYKDFAEIEYRMSGLFFILSKNNYGLDHLINGMKIDYDYHTIIKELFPSVFETEQVQKLLLDYKKATE